jgi:two-component system, chemotaxis family, CheB/CheR fusion protein
MKSKTRNKASKGGVPDKKASELERKKRSTSSRPMSARQTQDQGDKVQPDLNDLKRYEREAKAARDYAEATIRTVRDPLVVLRSDLHVNTANQGFYKTFKTTPDQTEGRLIYDLGDQQWNIPKLHILLEDILPRNSFFNDFEVTHNFPHIGRRTMMVNARRLELDDGAPQMILLAIEDVTERQLADAATASLAAIVNSSDDAIVGKDLDGIITSWNKGAERLFGYTAQEAIGQPITMLIPPDRQHEEPEILARLKRGERVDHFETVRVSKDGSLLDISLTISPIKDAAGRVIGASKIARDVTNRKRAEEELRRAHAELQARAEELSRFNSAAVGRELRMIELKKEINELYQRLGEPARYPLDFEQEEKEKT